MAQGIMTDAKSDRSQESTKESEVGVSAGLADNDVLMAEGVNRAYELKSGMSKYSFV